MMILACPPFCLDHDNRIYVGKHTDLSLIPSPPTHYQRNKILQLQKMSLRHALVGRKYGLDLARVAVKGPRSLSTRQLSTTSSRQNHPQKNPQISYLSSLRPSILSSCGTCVNCFNCSACPGCTLIPNRSMASAAEPKYV